MSAATQVPSSMGASAEPWPRSQWYNAEWNDHTYMGGRGNDQWRWSNWAWSGGTWSETGCERHTDTINSPDGSTSTASSRTGDDFIRYDDTGRTGTGQDDAGWRSHREDPSDRWGDHGVCRWDSLCIGNWWNTVVAYGKEGTLREVWRNPVGDDDIRALTDTRYLTRGIRTLHRSFHCRNRHEQWVQGTTTTTPASRANTPSETRQLLTVTVIGLSGIIAEIECDDCVTVEGLKQCIETVSGVPIMKQSLVRGEDLMWQMNYQLRDWANGATTMDVTMLQYSDDVARVLEAMRNPICSWNDHFKIAMDIKEAVLVAVHNHGDWLQHASEALRADKEIVVMAVMGHYRALQYADVTLQHDMDVLFAAVGPDSRALEYVPQEKRSDKNLILYALQHCDHAIVQASETLRADNDVIIQTISTMFSYDICLGRDTLLRVMDKRKLDDKEVALAAVRGDGRCLSCLTWRMKDDKDVVMAAARTRGTALACASKRMRAERSVVLEAVRESGYALRFATSELQADREVVTKAVLNYGLAVCFASAELRNDIVIGLLAVRQRPMALRFLGPDMQNNKDVVFASVKQDIGCIKYASAEIRQLFNLYVYHNTRLRTQISRDPKERWGSWWRRKSKYTWKDDDSDNEGTQSKFYTNSPVYPCPHCFR